VLVFVHASPPPRCRTTGYECLTMQIACLNAISKSSSHFFGEPIEFVFARLVITLATPMAQPRVRLQVRIRANPCVYMGGFADPPPGNTWHISVYPHPPLGIPSAPTSAYTCEPVRLHALAGPGGFPASIALRFRLCWYIVVENVAQAL